MSTACGRCDRGKGKWEIRGRETASVGARPQRGGFFGASECGTESERCDFSDAPKSPVGLKPQGWRAVWGLIIRILRSGSDRAGSVAMNSALTAALDRAMRAELAFGNLEWGL